MEAIDEMNIGDLRNLLINQDQIELENGENIEDKIKEIENIIKLKETLCGF